MAKKLITGIRTEDGPLKIDYNALENLPKSDATLTTTGAFADAKVTGDKIKETDTKIEKLTSGKTTAKTMNVRSLKADDFSLDGEAVDSYNLTMGDVATGKVLGVSGAIDLQHSHSVIVNDDGTITLGDVSRDGGNFATIDPNKDDYYYIVRQTGPMVSANSLDGLAIDTVSYIEPIQYGEGDPALDNIRPIIGRDNVEVYKTSKNLITYSKKSNYSSKGITWVNNNDGSFTISGKATEKAFFADSVGPIALGKLPQGKYTASVSQEYAAQVRLRIGKGSDKTHVADTNVTTGICTFTVNGEDQYWLGLYVPDETALSDTIFVQAQVEVGETATAFTPTQSQTITVDLPSTVYGGVLDWTTGKCKVTVGYVELTGNEDVRSYTNTSGSLGNGVQIMSVLPSSENRANGICSHASVYKFINTAGGVVVGNNSKSVFWPSILDLIDGISTIDEFKAWLANQKASGKPVQIAYELSEPIEIQVSPQQLIAIDGINYVWSNSGDTQATFNLAKPTLSLINGVLPISKGGTEATTPVDARENFLMVVSEEEPISPVPGMLWFDIS